MENQIVTYAFNMNSACVELRLQSATVLSIYCPTAEDHVADDLYERSEPIWLAIHNPVGYAECKWQRIFEPNANQ